MHTEKKPFPKGLVIALIVVVVVVIAVIVGVKAAKDRTADVGPAAPATETEAPGPQDDRAAAPEGEQPGEEKPGEEQPGVEQTDAEQTAGPEQTDAPGGAPGQESENQAPALLEDEGDIVIVLPEGMDSDGF